MQIRRIWRSASFRIAVIYTGLFCASVVLLFGLVYWSTIALIERQIADTVAAELRGLADQYREEGLGGLRAAVERRTAPGAPPEGVYLLADPQLRRVTGNLVTWPEEARPDGEWTRLSLYRSDREDQPLMVGARSFRLPGDYRLLVGRDMGARESFERTLLQALAWSLALTIALGAFVGWWLSRHLLRRVDAVNVTSRRIMHGDLSQRVPVDGGGDELDRLGQNLNQMLERIESLMTGMRLVTDSLAHDLRSPLTRLKGRIELTLLSDQDSECYRQTLEEVLAEADTIQSTFNALLAIAQAEAGVSRDSFTPLDLSVVAGDVVDLYQPAAEEKGLTMAVDAAGPVEILGHRQLLAQAVANLLDNAIKYSGTGSQVHLAVSREPQGESVLVIADNGPGIPRQDRNRVMERFVRLDQSRNAPGSGLGLSLVAAVARLHDSRLELEDNQPGLRVVWRFPMPGS